MARIDNNRRASAQRRAPCARGQSSFACLELAALAPACDHPELPMGPSPLTTGIILFEHANFLGNSAHITGDIPDLRSFKGPCVHDDGETVARDWNDCVSSVRIASGWRATIYKDT